MLIDGHEIIAPFRPLDWQFAPWRDKSRVLLLTGSAGGGKSRLAAEKIHGYCKKYPGAMALMLRKTRNSMTNSTVLFMERGVIGKDPDVRHYPSKNRFEYANGSILAYGGMANDEQREQIRSIGQDGSVDIVWMEEATGFSENDYNEITARLRGKASSWRQIILTTNPDAPTHWIYKRLIQSGEASVHYSAAIDNTYNPAEYLETLRSLTGILRQRLTEGRWVQSEGVVYDEFDYETHVLDVYESGRTRRAVAGVDWGFTNPGTIQVYALDGDDRMTLVRELYRTKQLIDWWVEQAVALRQQYNIETFVCDPAEPEHIEAFRRAGLPAIAANNTIAPGIQAVKQRLAVAADGLPRLRFLRSANEDVDSALESGKKPLGLLDEFTAYVWPKAQDGKPIKEVPVKEHDHGMDAMRYAVMYMTVSHAPLIGVI